MSTSYNYFIHMWREGTLCQDVTWRGYRIPAAIRPEHTRLALKELGFTYAGEHALSHFMALYNISDAKLAEKSLACWWLWSLIAKGKHPRVPLRGPGDIEGLAP